MDAVPCSTPVAHIQKSRKKIRSFPLINGESEDKILENAKQSDELVPIRLDMEIEGQFRSHDTWATSTGANSGRSRDSFYRRLRTKRRNNGITPSDLAWAMPHGTLFSNNCNFL